ncbi:MAG: hypothetical protein ACFFHV_19105 [Promethearchaeota archaeon]
MNSSEILKLLELATNGKDNIEQGAIGYRGYGFVFRDHNFIEELGNGFIFYNYFVGVGGSYLMRKGLREEKEKFGEDIFYYYDLIDALMIGSLKTLLPSLKFMDAEYSDTLFNIWVIIRTPQQKIFPVIYHFDRNRMGLGDLYWEEMRIYSQAYPLMCNSSLKEFTKDERDELADAFCNALKKVPTTDFRTIYPGHDEWFLIEINNGIPLFEEYNSDEEYLEWKRKMKPFGDIEWGK